MVPLPTNFRHAIFTDCSSKDSTRMDTTDSPQNSIILTELWNFGYATGNVHCFGKVEAQNSSCSIWTVNAGLKSS